MTEVGKEAAAGAPAPTIWIEIDDLIEFFTRHDQPTGIQRVVLELVSAATEKALPNVRLCRLNRRTGRFEALDLKLFGALIDWVRREGRVYQKYGRLHRRFAILARDILRLTGRSHPGRRHGADQRRNETDFASEFRPGDVVLSMGGAWANPKYAEHVGANKARLGFRFVQLIHDIIPIEHTATGNPAFLDHFTGWLHDTARLADAYLVPSRHVARSLAAYGEKQGWPPRPITPIRFGSGFSTENGAAGATGPRLVAEPYALCVATVDPRKNLELLLDVWERLVARHGAKRVPLLMLVGHRGFRSAEFFERLHDAGHIGHRVRFQERVSNEVLENLYQNADFTVFPSRAEGWGLPVEESLIHGRPVFSSNATSLPEVGGDLAEYFHPDDVEGACALIERAILEPEHLARMAERIRAEYRPRSWGEAFDQIVAAIG